MFAVTNQMYSNLGTNQEIRQQRREAVHASRFRRVSFDGRECGWTASSASQPLDVPADSANILHAYAARATRSCRGVNDHALPAAI